jgi:hypothetical protein
MSRCVSGVQSCSVIDSVPVTAHVNTRSDSLYSGVGDHGGTVARSGLFVPEDITAIRPRTP